MERFTKIFNGCKHSTENTQKKVWKKLRAIEKPCDIITDGSYVKPGISFPGGDVIILGVYRKTPKPTKTVSDFMITFLYRIAAFVARFCLSRHFNPLWCESNQQSW